MQFKKFITSLQSKPYAVRVRIMWLTTGGVAMLLLFIWISLVKIGSSGGQAVNQPTGPIDYIKELIGNAREQLTHFSGDNTQAPANPDIILKNFSGDEITKTLTIIFTIKNPSTDILNFWDPKVSSITLTDGQTELPAKTILTETREPFPQKILGNTEVAGRIIFPLPANKVVVVKVSNLSYLNDPEEKFSKSLTIDISSRNIRGMFDAQYPRE